MANLAKRNQWISGRKEVSSVTSHAWSFHGAEERHLNKNTEQLETGVSPAIVLADESLAELLHHSEQHGAGIVSKVQISDLHHRNRDDGKGLLVLLGGTRPQLWEKSFNPQILITRPFISFPRMKR